MQATQRQAASTGLFRTRRMSPSTLPAVSAAGFYPVSYNPALPARRPSPKAIHPQHSTPQGAPER